MRHWIIFLLLLTACPFQAKAAQEHLYEYSKSPHISDKVWETVKPYFLPSNHPIKKRLDQIFSTRPSASEKRLKNAGFNKPRHRPQSKMVVSHHPDLPGYLFKLYTDDQKLVDYTLIIHRIKGAESIKRSIKRHGYDKFFKVPKKWIYPLPVETSRSRGQNFVLVVEDAKILSHKQNYSKWRGEEMTQERAKAIFTLLKENGLRDTIHPFNLPFCKDGKMAFIDTEYHHSGPVHFTRMTRHMPKALRPFWQRLIAGQPIE
jgi:hypothetical protein